MISSLEYLIAVDSMLDEVIGRLNRLDLAECERSMMDRLVRAKCNVTSAIGDMMEDYE